MLTAVRGHLAGVRRSQSQDQEDEIDDILRVVELPEECDGDDASDAGSEFDAILGGMAFPDETQFDGTPS